MSSDSFTFELLNRSCRGIHTYIFFENFESIKLRTYELYRRENEAKKVKRPEGERKKQKKNGIKKTPFFTFAFTHFFLSLCAEMVAAGRGGVQLFIRLIFTPVFYFGVAESR